MARHIVDIVLDDDEEKLIKWLAKQDKTTVKQELRQLLALQIWEEQQLYLNEAKGE